MSSASLVETRPRSRVWALSADISATLRRKPMQYLLLLHVDEKAMQAATPEQTSATNWRPMAPTPS